jgi:manganese-dependent inorganic pyrophosphatase
MKNSISVIGHKNPDTDSICSAICYARLKNAIGGEKFEARRAGHVNDETQFVLDYFHVEKPQILWDVRPQIRDVDIRKIDGVSAHLSVRRAYQLMKKEEVVTLPVTEGSTLMGLVTMGDIARSYFEIYDNTVLSEAHTEFASIVDTLDGHVITGDVDGTFDSGKVIISAANPELMENYIDEGDLIILGNRYESQFSAIATGARCIIVCEGSEVTKSIVKMAESSGVLIISTPYDTYTVSRMINQSMPISFFMKRMDSGLVTFLDTDFLDDVSDVMAKKRHRYFPVINEKGEFAGLISRRNLLGAGKKRVIMVDHNEESQAVDGIDSADILEIIDHHRLGSLTTMAPVYFRNQPLGCTATIITQMYQERGIEIDPETAGLLCSAIISDTLLFRSPTCTEMDRSVCLMLAKIAGLNVEEYASQMFKAGSNLLKKEPKALFRQDYKTFDAGQITIGVGQVTSINSDEIHTVAERMKEYIRIAVEENKIDQAYFLLTDISEESSIVLAAPASALRTLENAFSTESVDGAVYLKGVVSRKKQFVPVIIETLMN